MKERVALAVIVGLLLTRAAGPAIATDLEQSLDVEPGGTLHIVLDRGTLHVDSHDRQAVRIAARARGWPWDVDFKLVREGKDV